MLLNEVGRFTKSCSGTTFANVEVVGHAACGLTASIHPSTLELCVQVFPPDGGLLHATTSTETQQQANTLRQKQKQPHE